MSDSHDLDAHLMLRTDDLAITGTLCVGPKAPVSEITAHTLMVFLQTKGVPSRLIDQDAVAKLVQQIQTNPGTEHTAQVARGKPPRHGDPQTLAWEPEIAERIAEIEARKDDLLDEPAPDHPPGDGEPDNAVNHYAHSAFIIVQEEQTLGTITPPDPGEDGEDIYGVCIPAKASTRPNTVDQDYIQLTEDNRVLARVRGRLRYGAANQSIDRTLNVDGDVGFATGHIDFPGPVVISGGVKDRFEVAAEGNTTIAKLVEAATIKSKRDIIITRGVAGRELATLEANRHVEAGYLESCTVRTAGDCTVKREITNCTIESRGTVRIPSGAIRGGRVAGARGIEAGTLGSVQEVRTELLVGSLPELDTLLLRANKLRDEAKAEAKTVRNQLDTLLKDAEAKTPQLVDRQMALEFELAEHETRIKKLDEAAARLAENIRTATTPTLSVKQHACAGSIVHIRGHRVHFKEQCDGPFELRVDAEGKPVIVRGDTRTPASETAEVAPSDLVPAIAAAPKAAANAQPEPQPAEISPDQPPSEDADDAPPAGPQAQAA